jgi:hypothetical protein
VAWSPWVPAFVFPGTASGSNRVANWSVLTRGTPSPVRPERSAAAGGAESRGAAETGTVSSIAAPNVSRSTSARRYSGARCA